MLLLSTKPKNPVLEATTPGAKSLWEENQYLKQKLAETTADLHKFKQLYAELLLKTGEDATKQPKSIRRPPSINSIGESVNGKSAVGQHSSCASAVLPDDFQELYAKDPIERAIKIPGCKGKSDYIIFPDHPLVRAESITDDQLEKVRVSFQKYLDKNDPYGKINTEQRTMIAAEAIAWASSHLRYQTESAYQHPKLSRPCRTINP